MTKLGRSTTIRFLVFSMLVLLQLPGRRRSRPLLNRLPKPMVWTRSGRSRRSATRSTWILVHQACSRVGLGTQGGPGLI